MRVSRLNVALMMVVGVLMMVSPASADIGSKAFGAGIGAGLVMLGAAYGIGLIGSRAVESMARQPEVAGNINGAMIVSAALIEGATFFALVVCLLIVFLG